LFDKYFAAVGVEVDSDEKLQTSYIGHVLRGSHREKHLLETAETVKGSSTLVCTWGH